MRPGDTHCVLHAPGNANARVHARIFSRGLPDFRSRYSPSERCFRGGVSGEMSAAGSAHALAADKLGKKRRQPIVNVFSHSNGEMILAMESLNRKATLRF